MVRATLKPFRMSRLTARIMAITLFPLAIFFVGLLSIDQYRTTLIQSEFVALERQGFTLARSLALAEAARDSSVVRRQLSTETMTHLLPLVGLGSSLRARVFQPNGVLLADTARRDFVRNVEIRRHRHKNWRQHTHGFFNRMIGTAASWFSPNSELPIYVERVGNAPVIMMKFFWPCQGSLRGRFGWTKRASWCCQLRCLCRICDWSAGP